MLINQCKVCNVLDCLLVTLYLVEDGDRCIKWCLQRHYCKLVGCHDSQWRVHSQKGGSQKEWKVFWANLSFDEISIDRGEYGMNICEKMIWMCCVKAGRAWPSPHEKRQQHLTKVLWSKKIQRLDRWQCRDALITLTPFALTFILTQFARSSTVYFIWSMVIVHGNSNFMKTLFCTKWGLNFIQPQFSLTIFLINLFSLTYWKCQRGPRSAKP